MRWLAGLFLLAAAPAAIAAPLSPAVENMLREAAKSDDLKTVTKVAKAANPDSAAEIDAFVAGLQAEAASAREAKLAAAGLFDGWSGAGQLGLARTTGNTDDFGLTAGLDLTKDGLRFRHKLHGLVDRQTTSGAVTRNKYLAGYELDVKFNQRLYAYGSASWDKDTFAGIGRRFSESAGAGYSLLNTPTMKLDLTAGPAFRQTRYVAAPPDNLTTARVGADYAWKITDTVTLLEKAEYFINSEIKSTTALNVPVRKALSAQLSFDYSHEEKVPPGRDPTDTATRMALVFSF